MRLVVRLVVTLLAVGLVFGMGVHYDVAAEDHWPYPDTDDLAEDYGGHVGERTLLFGTVESVDPTSDQARIRVEHTTGAFTLTVQGFEAEVEPGGTVQVLGTLEPDYVLTVERVVVVNPSGGAELIKFGLSAAGALLVLVVFFSRWGVDWGSYTFEGR